MTRPRNRRVRNQIGVERRRTARPCDRRGQRHPVPLHERGEEEAGGDAGQREVDEPGRQSLHLPVDDGQQHTSEDEGEHGGELGTQTKTPNGDGEQESGDAIEGVLLEEGWDMAARVKDRRLLSKSSILGIRPVGARA